MSIVITDKTRVPFGDVGAAAVEKIQQKLTIRNPQFEAVKKFSPWGTKFTKIPEFIRNYVRQPDALLIPNGFDVKPFVNGAVIKDKRVEVPVKFPEPRIELYPWQKEVGEIVKRTGGGVILAETSAGKTVGALSVAAHLGQKTIVLLHRMPLFEGWYKDIEKLFGIGRDAVGLIKRDTWKIGYAITLASVQTLIRRDFSSLIKEFGLLIADEGHLFPAPAWSKTVEPFWAKYRLTITATPNRRDHKEPLMYHSFGKVCYTAPEGKALPVLVKLVQTNFQYDSFFWPEVEKVLANDQNRNQLIVEEIIKKYNRGKKILILVRRRLHGKLLKSILWEYGLKPTLLLGGGISNETRFRAAKKGLINILISTYQLIALGSDLPPIDTVVLASPVRDTNLLAQSIGRARRNYPGKKHALVIDFVDDCRMLENAYRKRLIFYDKKATILEKE